MTETSGSSRSLPLDEAAATVMWEQYRSAHPEAVRAAPEYTVEHFGDNARLADELLAIVLAGGKRATAELRLGPFTSADAAFAADEGEDDLSLESWRREHRRYWTRVAAARGAEWSEDEDIVFERFSVVWPLEHAD